MSAVICCVIGVSLINIGVPWGVIPQSSRYAQNNSNATAYSSSTKSASVGSNSGVPLNASKASKESPASRSADAASPASVTSYAELPSDSYAANTILVSVSNTQDAQATLSKLGELGYKADSSVDASDIAAGFIKVQLNDDANPGIVSDLLNAQGIAAQPNFYYYLTDENEESENVAEESIPPSTSSSTKPDSSSSINGANGSVNSGNAAENADGGMGVASVTLSSLLNESASNANGITGESIDPTLSAIHEGEETAPANDRTFTLQGTGINDPNANRNADWLTTVDAFSAWDIVKVNKSVTVAVIDSGCNVNHEDLKDNIVGMYDTQSNGTSASDVTDDKNHGTHVAGIIAAKTNNEMGIAGVSYDAGLFIVRAIHKSNGKYAAESSDVIKAYQKIIENRTALNIRVVNMSLGTRRSGTPNASDSLVVSKINEAYSDYNILTVVAAGNSSEGTVPYRCYLCDYSDTLLGIINLQKNADGTITRCDSSNYNLTGERTKDLGAPGGSEDANIVSTVSNGGYAGMNGTSMASPCAAGIAALVFAANPNLTPSQASSVICSSATDIATAGFDLYTGYGCINAARAVQMAQSNKYISGADSLANSSSTALFCEGASEWTSDNSAVATVNANGVVTGRSGGYASISAMCGGEKVTKTIAVYDATIAGSSTVEKGQSSSYSVSCIPSGIWTFSSSNNSVATISENGSLTAKSAGTTTITATLSSNKRISISKDVTVTLSGTS